MASNKTTEQTVDQKALDEGAKLDKPPIKAFPTGEDPAALPPKQPSIAPAILEEPGTPRNINTNSEQIARSEKAELYDAKGHLKPPKDAPLGVHQLYEVLVVLNDDTPDKHQLFSLMGMGFTVGGLRSLFKSK